MASHGDDVRIVGTVASWLVGVDLPVGDVDVLARDRRTVDSMSAALTRAGIDCRTSPRLFDDGGHPQYFASFELDDTRIEVSTVESAGDGGLSECAGRAPWVHSQVVSVGTGAARSELRVVASELRLLSEVRRGRPDRWRPIGDHLARRGIDLALFGEALMSLPDDLRSVMQDAVNTRWQVPPPE